MSDLIRERTRTPRQRIAHAGEPLESNSSPAVAANSLRPGSSRSTVRRAVIVGASSGVGRALAEELARSGSDLLLVATDRRDLAALAADLHLRFDRRVEIELLDLNELTEQPLEICLRWRARLGGCDAVLIPAGYVDSDDDGLPTPDMIERNMRINMLSVVQLLTAAGRLFEKQGFGTLVAFSSIAAAAPRKKRIAYAASKAALEAYLQGLRHYFASLPSGAGGEVRVQTYALGYVDSAMSYGQKLLFPVAAPEAVARQVVRRLQADTGKVYYPGYWALITTVLKNLPWALFRRLKF